MAGIYSLASMGEWDSGEGSGFIKYSLDPEGLGAIPQMAIEPGSAQLGGESVNRGQSSLLSFLSMY